MAGPSILFLAVIAGLVAGSFLATIVVRWPRGERLSGRSHCDHCGATLGLAELIPLASFIAARGACRRCHRAIDRRHPLLELAAAAIAVLAVLAAFGASGGAWPEAVAGALFGWFLLALVALDVEHFWLPDRLTLPLLSLGLAFGLGTLPERLLGAAIGGGLLWLLQAGYRLLRRREGLGDGDVKLGFALGAWLGPLFVGPLFVLAALAGIAIAVFARGAAARAGAPSRPFRQRPLPFGAAMAACAFPLWLFGAAASATAATGASLSMAGMIW